MTYQKPTIVVLGDAQQIIQGLKAGFPPESCVRPTFKPLIVAYDPDE